MSDIVRTQKKAMPCTGPHPRRGREKRNSSFDDVFGSLLSPPSTKVCVVANRVALITSDPKPQGVRGEVGMMMIRVVACLKTAARSQKIVLRPLIKPRTTVREV